METMGYFMFENESDDKPISIIITTLASHAYNDEVDLFKALFSIIDDMPNQILEKDGNACIPNPVDLLENFADKWQEKPEKELKYTVQLRYTLAKSPQIKVLKPELIATEGKRLPHTYHGRRLCLYYPGVGDWRGDMLLSKIVTVHGFRAQG